MLRPWGIGSAALYSCENLSTIAMSKGITEIRDKTFLSCKKLRTLNWEDLQVQIIGWSAFSDCGFTEIVLPKTVKRIGRYAFYNNSKLKSIKITGEEITMSELVFFDCN